MSDITNYDEYFLRNLMVSLFFILLLGFILVEMFDCLNIKPIMRMYTLYPDSFYWDYIYGYSSHNGPATWKLSYPESAGECQSPINIETACSLVVNPSTDLKTQNWEVLPLVMLMQNNGHTVVIMADWASGCVPSLTGGPLGDAVYRLNNVSFRWGPNDDEGSEHTIDNNRYCLEVQISTTKEMSDNDDGCFAENRIAVISFLYNITATDNPYMDYIVNNLRKVKKPSHPVWISPFPLTWLKHTALSEYYAYSGSLTHPPCSEGVTWIVFPQPIPISAEQVRQFRKLKSRDGELILTNTRPVQLLNSRSVFYYD